MEVQVRARRAKSPLLYDVFFSVGTKGNLSQGKLDPVCFKDEGRL